MRTKCVPSAYEVRTKCARSESPPLVAYEVRTKCVRSAYEVRTKCVRYLGLLEGTKWGGTTFSPLAHTKWKNSLKVGDQPFSGSACMSLSPMNMHRTMVGNGGGGFEVTPLFALAQIFHCICPTASGVHRRLCTAASSAECGPSAVGGWFPCGAGPGVRVGALKD